MTILETLEQEAKNNYRALALKAGLKIKGKNKDGSDWLEGDEQSWATFDDLKDSHIKDLEYVDSLSNN